MANENYIVINGRKAELTKEQLKALGIVSENTPFDRVRHDEVYYCIGDYGKVQDFKEFGHEFDDKVYAAANYCADKDIMQQRAYAETLNRLLWRHSEQHKGEEDRMGEGYYVAYDCKGNTWEIRFCHTRYYLPGVVLFDTEEIAQSAIKEVVEPFMKDHPDFI